MIFSFRQFDISQSGAAMKVGTDSVLLGCFADPGKAKYILDIGSGTGLLALMMAQKSEAEIDAVEIDEQAFRDAMLNATRSPWYERVHVFHADIEGFQSQHKYDLIISNPPYFPAGKQFHIQDEQRKAARHGDFLSLENLANYVSTLLNENGKFWLILPVEEAEIFKGIAELKGLFLHHEIVVHSKLSKPANRKIMSFSNLMQDVLSESFLIYNENGQATEEYISKTKDFYLWKNLDDDHRLKI